MRHEDKYAAVMKLLIVARTRTAGDPSTLSGVAEAHSKSEVSDKQDEIPYALTPTAKMSDTVEEMRRMTHMGKAKAIIGWAKMEELQHDHLLEASRNKERHHEMMFKKQRELQGIF